jgi:hypothetical protein
MIFHPSILALLAGSILMSIMVLYAVSHAFEILSRWDLASGSELQLTLERKTYLISTLLAYVFAFEILSFFLYIFTTERLHVLFVGAMCAAGSLYVNPFGYPTLIVKLVNALLAGIWLILNYVDNLGCDYPLIRKKYSFLLVLAPLVLLETVLQANYFLRLKPNIITSCCGTLFSSGTSVLSSESVFSPGISTETAFYATVLLTAGAGLFYSVKGRGGYFFSGMCALALVVCALSFFSFISSYIYELPTHHCPFCLLQKEYGYVGYPLYVTLFGGAISGLSLGLLMPFRNTESLSERLPSLTRRLAFTSSLLFLTFASIVTVRILFSNLILEGS